MKRILSLLAAALVLGGAAALPVLAVGTPAGTVISNQASVAYTDANGNNLSALSNTVTTTVSQGASLTVDPNNSQGADPGDILYYAHLVTNGSNGSDTIDLTAVPDLTDDPAPDLLLESQPESQATSRPEAEAEPGSEVRS